MHFHFSKILDMYNFFSPKASQAHEELRPWSIWMYFIQILNTRIRTYLDSFNYYLVLYSSLFIMVNIYGYTVNHDHVLVKALDFYKKKIRKMIIIRISFDSYVLVSNWNIYIFIVSNKPPPAVLYTNYDLKKEERKCMRI